MVNIDRLYSVGVVPNDPYRGQLQAKIKRQAGRTARTPPELSVVLLTRTRGYARQVPTDEGGEMSRGRADIRRQSNCRSEHGLRARPGCWRSAARSQST